MYSWADSKKKSNLVLSVFAPGIEIPWLGNLKRLMPSAEMQENPYKLDGEMEESPFPVETSRRRSYQSQASVVWVKGSGLQVQQHTAKKHIHFDIICGAWNIFRLFHSLARLLFPFV
jgi:hypothetical protein